MNCVQTQLAIIGSPFRTFHLPPANIRRATMTLSPNIRRRASARLTFTGNNTRPEWSSSGTRVFFSSGVIGQADNVFSLAADGSGAARLTENDLDQRPQSVSPDASVLRMSRN